MSEELLFNVLEKRFYCQLLGVSLFVHSTNCPIFTLGFIEIIRSMLDSKPISISLLHLFQFIDIYSQELRPLRTAFHNLELFTILGLPVETWLWFSLRKPLCY